MTIIPPNLIGLTVSGDMGGETFFTNKNGLVVVFPQSPPKCPATLPQIIQRARFRRAVGGWNGLPLYIKGHYRSVCNQMSIAMLGINLYIHLAFSQDWGTIHTIYNQTGITLGLPPRV